MIPDMPAILIVEDVRMIAEYIELVVLQHGYRVAGIVTTGEEAVGAAIRTNPDLVLMDIKLQGGMDGITAAELIHRQAGIPIIYITAYTEKAVFERAMLANPAAYLHKPFKGNELIDSIDRVLDRTSIALGQPRSSVKGLVSGRA